MNLAQVKTQTPYQISDMAVSDKLKAQLQHLGIIPKAAVVLLQKDQKNGILMVRNTRIALDCALLEKIQVVEAKTQGSYLSLDKLQVGESGQILSIYGQGAFRRRLMDMGLTKNVQLTVRKLAPLGDPIEITVRGYELTLRKKEAELVLIEKAAAI